MEIKGWVMGRLLKTKTQEKNREHGAESGGTTAVYGARWGHGGGKEPEQPHPSVSPQSPWFWKGRKELGASTERKVQLCVRDTSTCNREEELGDDGVVLETSPKNSVFTLEKFGTRVRREQEMLREE